VSITEKQVSLGASKGGLDHEDWTRISYVPHRPSRPPNQIAREYHHHHTDIPSPPNPIAYEPDACDYSPQHEGNHPKAFEALATLLQAL
jgi:hypothetical protein